LGNGRQYMSWISLADQMAAVEFLMTAKLSGPVNLTGPVPVPNAVFSDALAHALRRPGLVPAPRFAMRLVLGELADNALESTRVVRRVLQAAGFEFRHPDVDSAMRWAVGRR